MSALEICNHLQRKDPVFTNISQKTIHEWIDQSGTKPRWSDNALQMAENENHQLHPNRDQYSVLVSNVKPLCTFTSAEENRLHTQMSWR
jgi:hypothetical protein